MFYQKEALTGMICQLWSCTNLGSNFTSCDLGRFELCVPYTFAKCKQVSWTGLLIRGDTDKTRSV